jgi:hypothetical protein
MNGGIRLQFPSLLNSRILRRLDGKWLFHAAAEDRIAVLVLFDKEVFVVIAALDASVLFCAKPPRDPRQPTAGLCL